jgi:hypothetical protein
LLSFCCLSVVRKLLFHFLLCGSLFVVSRTSNYWSQSSVSRVRERMKHRAYYVPGTGTRYGSSSTVLALYPGAIVRDGRMFPVSLFLPPPSAEIRDDGLLGRKLSLLCHRLDN